MDLMQQQDMKTARHEPMFNVPPVVLVLIAVLGLIALGMYGLDDESAAEILLAYGFVPADWSSWFGLDALTPAIDAARADPTDARLVALAELAAYLKLHPGHGPVTVLTYAFLHGGFEHVVMNSIWLLAFGSPVARRIGTFRFLALFVMSAIGGAALHYIFHPSELMPLVGASGAIAGLMAGAVRFMFQPGEPLSGFVFPRDTAIRMPPMPLRRLIRDPRPLRFILLWIAVNLLTGVIGTPFMSGVGSIAWEAHLGGFFVGLFVFTFVDPPIRLPDDEILPLHDRTS